MITSHVSIIKYIFRDRMTSELESVYNGLLEFGTTMSFERGLLVLHLVFPSSYLPTLWQDFIFRVESRDPKEEWEGRRQQLITPLAAVSKVTLFSRSFFTGAGT